MWTPVFSGDGERVLYAVKLPAERNHLVKQVGSA
jgi:hypothetical protein